MIRRPSRNPATGELRDALAGGGDGPPGDALERVGAAIGVPVRRGDADLALWTKLVANVLAQHGDRPRAAPAWGACSPSRERWS